MGAVKSVGRILRPSGGLSASEQQLKRPPEPAIGTQSPVTPTPTPPSPSDQQPSQELLNRLRDVYVESTTDIVTNYQTCMWWRRASGKQENPFGSEKPSQRAKLPQDRSASYDDKFHAENSPEGYLTVRQVLEIFDKRRETPSEWTAEEVARQYAIDGTDAEHLLKYFNNYRVLSTEKPSTKLEYHPLHR